MKLLKLSAYLMTSAAVLASVLPANADTNLPDLSNNDNPLAVCKKIKLGSETKNIQVGLENGENQQLVYSVSKDQIGHDCDGIAEEIARVEMNRADNETFLNISKKKANVEFLKVLFSW